MMPPERTYAPPPTDQAQGLRQMCASRVLRFIPVVANGTAGCGGMVLERLCSTYSMWGLNTLVFDASEQARAPGELVKFDLTEGVERLSEHVSYMPARGLPLRHVNAQGSCASLLDALADASPQSDVVLMHASASELVRLFAARSIGVDLLPLVYCNDMAEGLKSAYMAVKVLSQRGGWMAYDLCICASKHSTQADAVAMRLAHCTDAFLGAAQRRDMRLNQSESAMTDPHRRFMEVAAELLQGALPLALGDNAFNNLVSHRAALPASVATAIN